MQNRRKSTGASRGQAPTFPAWPPHGPTGAAPAGLGVPNLVRYQRRTSPGARMLSAAVPWLQRERSGRRAVRRKGGLPLVHGEPAPHTIGRLDPPHPCEALQPHTAAVAHRSRGGRLFVGELTGAHGEEHLRIYVLARRAIHPTGHLPIVEQPTHRGPRPTRPNADRLYRAGATRKARAGVACPAHREVRADGRQQDVLASDTSSSVGNDVPGRQRSQIFVLRAAGRCRSSRSASRRPGRREDLAPDRPPTATVSARSSTTLPGSWTASGLRNGPSAVDGRTSSALLASAIHGLGTLAPAASRGAQPPREA